MRITFDRGRDLLRIDLVDEPDPIGNETRIYEPHVRAHIAALYNNNDKVVALEFRFASRILPREFLDEAEGSAADVT
jgi:hypothetical protein